MRLPLPGACTRSRRQSTRARNSTPPTAPAVTVRAARATDLIPKIRSSDFSDPQYAIFKSQADWQSGWQAEHPQIGQDWSAEDRSNVLEYIRTFSYLPPWESPYKPGTGVISGMVVPNASASTPVEGMPIVLEAYIGFDQVAAFTSTVSAGGVYTFENLATDPSIAYVASVGYDDISYSSDFVSLTPITPTLQSDHYRRLARRTIRRVSTSAAHTGSWIISPAPSWSVRSTPLATAAIAPSLAARSRGWTSRVRLELHVPEGATEITFDNGALGDRFQQVGNTIYDTLPVIPGTDTRQIVLRYAIPYNGTSLDIKTGLCVSGRSTEPADCRHSRPQGRCTGTGVGRCPGSVRPVVSDLA